jgi:peptidoglycan/xylan/chitin deacetylase (PgdA/CDA1 family)
MLRPYHEPANPMTRTILLIAAAICCSCLAAGAADPKPSTAPAANGAANKPSAPPPVLAAEKATVDSPDGTSILKWKGGKRAAFYLAFDDACPSHLVNVIPELERRKIVGTFYVIAGSPMFNGNKKWEAAAKSPYAVFANHTFKHKDFPTLEAFEGEVAQTNKVILRLQPGTKETRVIAFGKPGGVKYGITDAQIEEVLAKHDMVNRLPFWTPVIHVKTADDMHKGVDQTIKKGEVGHLDFHGVGGDWLVTPVDFFRAVLDKLDASREVLWVSDTASIMKYAAERKASQVKVVENAPGKVRLSLTTTLDARLYDEPLSLATKVPAGWKQAVVTQGETKATVPVAEGIVVYDAIAGGPEVVLTEGR